MADSKQKKKDFKGGKRKSDKRSLKVSVTAETSAYSQTFVFQHEDHTLGNALRHIIMRDPEVDLCGYTIPHPMEPVMHMRLQTSRKPAKEALADGLDKLSNICDQIDAAFDAAIQNPTKNSSASMEIDS